MRTEVERLRVTTPEGPGGSLAHEAGQYVFSYDGDRAAARIALSMPVRALPYVERELHPILQMNLPEGFLLEALRLRLAKLGTLDPMLLLSLTGGEHAIGRVRVTLPDAAPAKASRGESLHDMLAWDGTGDLFRLLVDRYLLRAGISGVQPKVLVPERPDEAGKATVATADLIVKSGRAEYPGLAANEYLCMSIAREAGMPVPEFFLSANRQLLV
ncbi:HipA, partial [mine drainage metagenome]